MRYFKSLKLFWLPVFPLLFVVCLLATWIALSNQSFFYGFLYDNTKLENFIELYAPKNIYKPEFSQTSREERIRVFKEIVESVNSNGLGLSEIKFYSIEGESLGKLLREPEVVHLQLVANIVDQLAKVAKCSSVLLLGFLIFVVKLKVRLVTLKEVILSTLALFGATVFILLVIGPLTVFEYLHVQIFPKDHQWFFYYEDSLMTTLMMAPDLFAYFFATWLVLSVFLFLLVNILLIKMYKFFLDNPS